jgi:uncharacterized protein
MQKKDIKKLFLSFNSHMKKKFNCRIYKISIDGGFNCPNRDGSKSKKGCIFCDKTGSSSQTNKHLTPINVQIENNIKIRKTRYKAKKFIAYFQSFTNTYLDVNSLRKIYNEAVFAHSDIIGLAISTRPDCVDEEKIKLIAEYKKHLQYVCIEYGCQTIHDKTLKLINRCEDHADFVKAVKLTKKYNIEQVAHIILGLPGETRQDMIDTAKEIAKLKIDGVKIHLLVVMKNTCLEKMYLDNKFTPLTFDKYIQLICDVLEHLPKTCIIHRFSGSGHPKHIISPKWVCDVEKNAYTTAVEKEFQKRGTHQGYKCIIA